MDSTRRGRRRLIALVALMVVTLPLTWYILTYRSRRAVHRIQGLNGRVDSTRGIFLPRGLGRLNYGVLDSVYLLGPQTGNSELEALRDLPALRRLDLTNTRVTDDGLAELNQFPSLNSLCIANIDTSKMDEVARARLQAKPLITGKGLAHLKDLPDLQVVQLFRTPTTDEDLGALKGLKNLIMLDLRGTQVTASGVAELKKALPNCRIVLR